MLLFRLKYEKALLISFVVNLVTASVGFFSSYLFSLS
jgi:hypothetical protein